jgi:large subunit ribosomal protein L10
LLKGGFQVANITEDKVQAVAELKERIARAKALTVTDYRGLSVAQMNSLRGKLREVGTDYKVVKNTLTRIALRECGAEESFVQSIVGPVALAFDYEDVTAGIKVLTQFAKENKQISISGGYVEGHTMTSDQMEVLSKMPGKDELRAQLLSLLKTPARNFVSLVSAPVRNMVCVLKAYADKE